MFDYCPVEAPYPGLRPFEPHESEIFFGRDGHTDRLLEILQQQRFLAVIGPSGCGKSSLVRAGLLPALAAGRLGTGSHWRLALLRPGGQSLLALAQALIGRHALGPELIDAANAAAAPPAGCAAGLQPATVDDATPDAALVAAELRRGMPGFERLLDQADARRRAAPPLNLLILVDQFEEVFTYRDADADPGEAARFIDLLIAARDRGAAPSPGGIRVCVALTMRTDFLGHCVAHEDLPEAINRGQYLTPRLKPDEMRAAIHGPARVFGGSVDDAFAEEIIAKVGGNSDQLPLLQHALARWWREAETVDPDAPRIDAGLTERAGRVEQALDLHAEELFEAMTPDERAAAEALFRAITEGREGSEAAVRRPQCLRDIVGWTGVDRTVLMRVIERLADPEVSFIHHGRGLGDAMMIDLTHEALMRQWGRLKGWVDDERRRGLGYRRWQARAAEHAAGQAGLLSGADLGKALEWWNPGVDEATRWQPGPLWAERYGNAGDDQAVAAEFERLREFLVDSRDAESKAREAEQQRLQREAEDARQSEQERTASLFESQLTHASLLARVEDYAEARRVLSETTKLDAGIPLERRHARNLLAGHLRIMGGEADKVYAGAGAALAGGVAVSPDGRLIAAAGERATLVIFDATSGRLLRRLEGHDAKASDTGSVRAIAFGPSGDGLYSGGDDGRIIRWSMPAGEKLGEWTTGGDVRGLAVSPDGRQLANGGMSGTITLRSLPDGNPVCQLEGHVGTIADSTKSLTYTRDGKRLASASYDKTARIWDVETGKTLHVFNGHNERVTGVAFTNDGELLATSSGDRRIVLWHTGTGEPVRVLTGHQNVVFGIGFTEDGQQLLSASRDNTLRLWDVNSGVTRRVFQGHEASLWSVVLHGDRIYTAANDGTVRRWALGTPGQSAWATDEAAAAAIAPRERWMAVGLASGALRLYALPGGEPLGEVDDAHGRDVNRIAFTPDGRLLATGGHDNKAKIWEVSESARSAPRLSLRHTIDHSSAVNTVAFSPDGSRLATASYDGRIGLFDMVSGKGRTVQAHQGVTASVVFDPTGKSLLSTGGEDSRLRLWSADDLDREPRELARLQDRPAWSSLSPDGHEAASVGRDQAVTLFDLARPEALQHLVGHENTVYRAIYSPDGRQLATVGSDMTLRLWDLHSQRLLFTQRLPASWESSRDSPLWDFDFRCVPGGDCWIAVPLTMGRVVVYRLPYDAWPGG